MSSVGQPLVLLRSCFSYSSFLYSILWILSSFVSSMASSMVPASLPSFALNRAVILPVQGGSPTTFTYATNFLFQKPEAAQQTFRDATRHLQGLPLAGISYESHVDALTCYFKGLVYGFQEQTGDYTSHQPPTVLVLCKGEQKCHFLRQLLTVASPY